jgi:hypothetical protein
VRRVVLLTLALLSVSVASAGACSIPALTPRQLVRGARIAVFVKVLSVQDIGTTSNGSTVWEARVRRLETYKGEPPLVFRVRSDIDDASCGLDRFRTGQRTGLLLYNDDRRPPYWIALGDLISRSDLRRARHG